MNIISKLPAKLCSSLVVLNLTNFCLLVRFAVPEETDFSWLDTVSFGNGDFERVFQRGTQGKATLTQLARHVHQTLRRQETKVPVIKKAVIPLQVKALIFPHKIFSPALKKGVQSLLPGTLQ